MPYQDKKNIIRIESLEYRLRMPKDMCIEYPVKLCIQEKCVNFLVSSIMLENVISNLKDHKHLLFLNSEKEIIEVLKTQTSFDIFSKFELLIYKNTIRKSKNNVNERFSHKEPIEIYINNELNRNLIQSAYEYEGLSTIIQNVLDKLKKYAFELESDGYEYYKTKMITYWKFIKNCFEKSYNYHAPNYNEILSDIYQAINELARKKRENNYNYQYHKKTIQQRTFSLHPPEIWLEKPLIPEEIKNEFIKSY